MQDPILVEVMRGGLVESRHAGAVAVVDAKGGLVLGLGDIDRPVFPRSAVKVIQALPMVESGAASRFGLDQEELALTCASHGGEPRHVAVARGVLAKLGLEPDCLECGVQWPSTTSASQALARAGEKPSALHNNCSGKHSGFLCLACDLGAPPPGYVLADHPVQRRVTATLSEVTGARLDETNRGIDGCSIPTYAMPLRAVALGFARIGTGEGLHPDRADAARQLRRAVAEHPFLVAGTRRFDTVVMEALGERAFLKVGAEGVYTAALPELGLGVALKCDDGAKRGAEALMAALLLRLLPLSDAEAAVVRPLAEPVLKNWNGLEVGRVRPVLPA
ncbi:asparaginase [Roseomonas sp. OT10]|uniref:asparaginase n=1 Tax=Roseomonas cutis TaxID=2897332 RepID=UPI001E498439|nr:asparaginase [Roseomonas sp. OT10]UFN47630.1 asparaginase [Roseomonas sp. OT10]